MKLIERIRQRKQIVKAVAYARFSSDNQREESITAQLRAINEYAKRNEIIIIEEYIDKAKSGTTDNRPEFLRMISDSKNNDFDMVLVHKLDRFARNRHDSIGYRMELKRHGVSLVSVLEYLDDESPESIILESVLEAMGEYYSKNLAREVNKGMRETALKAMHTGGSPPLGYDVDSTTKKLIINEREAIAIRIIFKMYNEGIGYDKIAHELNVQGFTTKTGAKFGHNSFHGIIRNEKYMGVYVFNKVQSKDVDGKRNGYKYKDDSEIIRIDGAIPAIISKEEFQIAQERAEKRKRSGPTYTAKEVYLLSGKIVCGECGMAYIGNRKFGGRNKRLHVTYRCNGRRSKKQCKNKEIRREYIETFVLESFAEYIFNDELIPKLVSSFNDYQLNKNSEYIRKTSGIKNRLDEIEKEIKNLTNAIAKIAPSEALINKLAETENEKILLEAEYKKLEITTDYKKISESELKKSFKIAKRLMKKGNLDSTKKLIEMYVDKVVVYNDWIDVVFKFHEDLVL